jgi:hypothetical protein
MFAGTEGGTTDTVLGGTVGLGAAAAEAEAALSSMGAGAGVVVVVAAGSVSYWKRDGGRSRNSQMPPPEIAGTRGGTSNRSNSDFLGAAGVGSGGKSVIEWRLNVEGVRAVGPAYECSNGSAASSSLYTNHGSAVSRSWGQRSS